MKDIKKVKGVTYNGIPGSFSLMTEVNDEVQFNYPSDEVKIRGLVLCVKNQCFLISKAHKQMIEDNSNLK